MNVNMKYQSAAKIHCVKYYNRSKFGIPWENRKVNWLILLLH